MLIIKMRKKYKIGNANEADIINIRKKGINDEITKVNDNFTHLHN